MKRVPVTQLPVLPGAYYISLVGIGSWRDFHCRREIDWNKLEAEVKQEEKDEKLDGDAGLQKFFQGLYAGSDEDTRRAMNKSFQESNGTVLSTDWKDIGSKKIKEYSSEDKDKYSGGGRKLRK